MTRASDLVGRQVVDARGGERLGKVSDLLVDADRLQLAGLVVRSGILGHEQVLPFDAVEALGGAAVVARSAAALVDASEWPRRAPRATRSSRLRGKEVVTAAGRRLGTVCDVYLDERTGRLDEIEVEFTDAALATRWMNVSFRSNAKLGSDAVIVRAPDA